ncbi:MAG: hypothetical protein ABIA63_12605 [bacterium]
MGFYYGFAPYVSVGEKKQRAERIKNKLRKKHVPIQPVELEGSKLANTWWGKAWNKNLESYADYSNRIGRGRSYVRCNAVIDLKIESGKVTAQVMGSHSKPYKVQIAIKPLTPLKHKKIVEQCEGKLESVDALLSGSFPKEMESLFTQKSEGLFPSPGEIKFDCSCPDWASMCKHVAAALYGVAVHLDNRPELFFDLRNVKMQDLIGKVVKKQAKKMIKSSKKKSTRIIEAKDKDLSELFGVSMDTPSKPKKKPVKKRIKNKTVKGKKKVIKKKTKKS